jgi:hypothetical protein
MVGGLKSDLRLYIPEEAKLLELRNRMGYPSEELIQQVDSFLKSYNESRDQIVNMERAGVLCRIAELYSLLGCNDKAVAVYGRAVEEGQVNPNSRPQADDLNRICCSMALHGVQPTEALWRALNEMKNSLGAPW